MERETPAWGIEPVPERLRVLGFVDTTLLWANLGVSLLVLVAGTFLVPALSLRDALIAIAIGGVIGNHDARHSPARSARRRRVPAMVLMRRSLGRRGSYARDRPQRPPEPRLGDLRADRDRCRGRGALSDQRLRLRGKWLWTILFGAAHGRRWRSPGRSRSCAASCGASRSGSCSRRSSISPGGRSTTPTSSAFWVAPGRASRCGTAST